MTATSLLALAPLRLEARAVSRGAPGLRVERTGPGPRRAAAAAARLAAGHRAGAPVAVTGIGGALVEGLVPGELIVADRVVDANGGLVAVIPSASLLASALRRGGLRARVGTVASADRVVRGRQARAALAAHGAMAVDMESAAILRQGWDGPVAVVRAVADTPERELISAGTVAGGIAALRALRAAAPHLATWAAAVRPRRVVLASPRSFCAGVDRAIETVERAIARYGAPVYVRRQIVHNSHVVAGLEAQGAVFVEELHDVPDGATVVLSAHGVAPAVRDEAARRGLAVIDATCPLVAKVHSEIRRFHQRGYQIVLVGHGGHDETEGSMGEAPGIQLVSTAEDAAAVDAADPDRVAYVTQTTLAPDETSSVIEALRDRYPALAGPHASDICYATQNRQDAVRAAAVDSDVVLVVGSPNSSNAARLVEVARRSGTPAHLVDDPAAVDLEWLSDAGTVAVTAGASTPEAVVSQVVEALRGLGPLEVAERTVHTENVSFSLPPEVR
ncbi:4-hydroxy-3-methylbut-2-enyl diphosphate reductase [Acidiferrimicrobium sp. IK]|uniref:4-hydroxy-3-methylbut-2-enyl diphosphate reductase n=1 Tax=Acidiferrimicrobium sp. IK TaxID=2871700 RepID=UPI0021CB533F|nr:4-hydroxy-3-methylbut-2-enyl diphosphate reductase [Acidiferrimicrobium sp. IK]MCU4184529.1 4-hydroxy-3-methylbut-2-enyl diphosphate reductase [Acidiferrimicrobium sp. IK]